MRTVTLPVSTKLLEQLFSLPEGVEVVGIEADGVQHFNFATVRFILASETFPEHQQGAEIPTANLRVHVDTLPLHPMYRHVVTDVELP